MSMLFWADGVPQIAQIYDVGGLSYWADGTPIAVIYPPQNSGAAILAAITAAATGYVQPVGVGAATLAPVVAAGVGIYRTAVGVLGIDYTTPNIITDPTCVANWRFEDNLTDYNRGNDLSGSGVLTYNALCREGSKSLRLGGASYVYRNNADLSPDWPHTFGSISGWFYFTSMPYLSYNYLWSKGSGFALRGYSGGSEMGLEFYMGSSRLDTSADLAMGRWYFVSVNFGPCYISGWTGRIEVSMRIWDHTAQAIVSYGFAMFKSSGDDAIVPNNSPFIVGADVNGANRMTGYIDELNVWNRHLSILEMEDLQQQFFHSDKNRSNNYWSSDPACYAAWEMDTGAQGIDSSGKGNTLSCGSQFEPCSLFMAGNRGTRGYNYGVSHGGAERTNANLTAGFPLKSTDTVKKITVCVWVVPRSGHFAWGGMIICKGMVSHDGHFPFGIEILSATKKVKIYWNDRRYSVFPNLKDSWAYHIAVMADGINRTLRVDILEHITGNRYIYDFNPPEDLGVNSEILYIGSGNLTNIYNGFIDQLAIFGRLLSDSEIDDMRDGRFAWSPYTWRKLAYNDYIVAPVLFDEHTVLTAEVYKTPKGEAITENTIMGRRATRTKVEALTPAEALAILGAQPTSDWLSN